MKVLCFSVRSKHLSFILAALFEKPKSQVVMKYLMMLVFCLFAGSVTVNAQDMGLGNILGEIQEGIKPEAFKGSFDASEWKDGLKNLDPSNLDSAKESVGGLLKGLKGKAFDGANKMDMIKSLAGLNDMGGIKDLLSKLVGGLNPAMLTDAFKGNKDKLLGALKMLG
jgi:hypothetical protein